MFTLEEKPLDGTREARATAAVMKAIADTLGMKEGEFKQTDSLANDLGADSIDNVEIVMGIEEELSVEITDDELQDCRTVADLVQVVQKHLT